MNILNAYGIYEADLFVDASGFNAVLFKHLNPTWHDTSNILPIDRAIPQQVPYDFKETPAFTTCEQLKMDGYTDTDWR